MHYAARRLPGGSTMLAAMVPLVVDRPGCRGLPPAGRAAAPGRPGAPARGGPGARAVVEAEGRDGFYGGEFGQGLMELGAGEYDPIGPGASPLADWVAPLGRRVWGADVWTDPARRRRAT